eukprot:Platyproteum_vivax@DN6248_c0_g1_i1.p1
MEESKFTAGGKKLVTCNSPVGVLGLSVCYDLRFPEMYTELTSMGAQVLLVPSAFTLRTGIDHWSTLLSARAIENQCFVVAAAQFGKHSDTRESFGHSAIIDPWGLTIGQVSNGSDHLALAFIDHALTSKIRTRMPMTRHDNSHRHLPHSN